MPTKRKSPYLVGNKLWGFGGTLGLIILKTKIEPSTANALNNLLLNSACRALALTDRSHQFLGWLERYPGC